MTAFTLYINDEKISEQKGGYIQHSIEITDYVKEGKNKVFVEVDSTERKDIHPFGYVIDYLTFGGIYRDVWQYEVDNTFIKNLFFKYEVLEQNGKYGKIKCMPIVEIDCFFEEKVDIVYNIFNEKVCTHINGKKGVYKYNLDEIIIDNVLWSINNPKMNLCNIDLIGDISKDNASLNIGFRDLKVLHNGVFINGKK